MDDTPPEIYEKMNEMYQKKTPAERLEMGVSMYATSKYLITQAILRENPQISKAGLKRELFLTFYGDDFTEEQKEKIIKYLESNTED